LAAHRGFDRSFAGARLYQQYWHYRIITLHSVSDWAQSRADVSGPSGRCRTLVPCGALGFTEFVVQHRVDPRCCLDAAIGGGGCCVLGLAGIVFYLYSLWVDDARALVVVCPGLHPNVTAAELLLIQRQREHLTQDAGDLPWRALLSNRETGLLTLAYFSQCFVFYLFFTWFFHYLVVELGFTVLETGVLAALPWVTGAVTATIGGAVCDRLCRLLGPRLGCRIPAMMGLAASGCFLYLGLYAGDPYIAVALLSLCFAGTQFTEGAFWSAQTYVAGPYTAPACALMNTGGNLAGIIVAPLMPYLASHIGWVLALSTGGGVAFFGAAVWLWIRADVPLQAPQAVR